MGLVFVSGVLGLATITVMPASAVSTRSFELDDAASLAAGELRGAAVFADGRVAVSVGVNRLELPPGSTLVWSSARVGDAVYLGTGNTGAIHRYQGDTITPFAETGQLVVSAMAVDPAGALFAGTLPEGRVYAVDPTGAVTEIAKPDETEHIWDLVWDPSRSRLFAATGPHGRVYSMRADGSGLEVWWDSSAAHVMTLALADDGALYAGTSDDALVVRLRAPGQAEIVYDFPGNEITSIDWRDHRLAVAANEFAEPPAPPARTAQQTSTSTRATRPRPGKARVWTLTPDGQAERIWSFEEGHAAAVQLAEDGTVYAALGNEGRIVRVDPDERSAIWIDVDERQILTMDMVGGARYFATADGAAFYRVVDERAPSPVWESKVLDADFRARWGEITWRATGRLEIQTRSGNSERPDETWSEWSRSLTKSGPIRSAPARFLQIRALFGSDRSSELHAVQAYYLPRNQRARVSRVGLKATPTKQGEPRDRIPTPSGSLLLSWQVENPDGDRLRYRLRYREESQSIWRTLLNEREVLTESEYTWTTFGLPDGYYIVEVEASDELANPPDYSLRSTSRSEPLMIDHHPPRIIELVVNGARARGRVVDSLGPIARIEYQLDGDDWHMMFPIDDLLDTRDERFALDLSGEPAGPRILAIRAFDGAGNQVVAEASLTIPARRP